MMRSENDASKTGLPRALQRRMKGQRTTPRMSARWSFCTTENRGVFTAATAMSRSSGPE
jgi:hypothetical protein